MIRTSPLFGISGNRALQRLTSIPWFLPLATLLLYLLRHTYRFPDGNQDDILPLLLHLLDPELLATDWLVTGQADTFGTRTLFSWFTYWPARWMGPAATYALLYVVSWFCVAHAVFALSYRISASQVAATGAVVAVLLLTPKFTLGGNDLAVPALIPSSPAWGLALWGLLLCDRGRHGVAAVLLGVSTWLQALIGLQMTGLCALLMLVQRKPLKALLLLSAIYAVVALPALGPQVLQQWETSTTDTSLYHILFELRAPHHYIPTRFDAHRSLAFAGLLGLSLGCFPLLSKKQRQFPVQILGVVALYCIVGYAGTELARSESIGKLQLFKITVVGKIMIVAVICHAISKHLPRSMARCLALLHARRGITFAGVAVAATLLVTTSPNALGFRSVAAPEDGPDHLRIEAWAQAETPKDAVFAVPPSWDGFRSRAQRSIVVNFRAIPYQPPRIYEWYTRLKAFAPEAVSSHGSLKQRIPQMDAAFFALPWETVSDLGEQYGFNYIVRSVSKPDTPHALQPIFTAGDLAVFQVTSITP